MTTGLRKSEALTLKWENVDWTKKTFTAIETKNKSNHIVPMSSTTEWIMKEQKKVANNSPFVFPSERTGTHMTEPKSQLERIRKATGLNFRFHDLRACAITNLFLKGWSVAEVSVVSGHKTWAELKRYTRIKPIQLVEKINKI